jgi:aldose 1-epimerase
VNKQPFGKMPDGTPIELHTVQTEKIEAQFMAYGAGIVSLRVPDRTGHLEDVVLGFADLAGYVRNHSSKAPIFLGSAIGRYANRIAQARFSIDGKTYTLAKNNGEHSLHGGPKGFYNVVWKGEPIENGVAFHYLSVDGEEGFPGNLKTTVRYTLSGSELKIEYLATSDKTTVLNLTNHAYFNLAGGGRGNILSHKLKLFASRFTPADAGLIPTGELRPVAGTPLDFRESTSIGQRIDADDQQLHLGHGYDHNFVLDDAAANLKPAAELYDPASGRLLAIWTTEPAIQFYSGNFLDGSTRGGNGLAHAKRSGLCLETQHYPDSPNHPEFPSTLLHPGETFRSITVLKFGVR